MTEMTKIQTLLRAYNRAYLVSLQSQEELFSLARMVGAAIDERLDELPNRSAEVEGTDSKRGKYCRRQTLAGRFEGNPPQCP